MVNLEKVLLDLVKPITDDPDAVTVETREDTRDEIVLAVKARNEDIARLIGRKGQMARAIRDTLAIAGRSVRKHISVKFEEL